MARKGLTREVVFQTIEHLRKDGVALTITSIRKKLKRGSLTTISRYLSEWQNSSELERMGEVEIGEILLSITDEFLKEYLERQHPQIAALIISHLPHDRLVKIIAQFKGQVRDDLVRRIEKMESVQLAILTLIAKCLKREFGQITFSKTFTKTGGKEIATKIRRELRK